MFNISVAYLFSPPFFLAIALQLQRGPVQSSVLQLLLIHLNQQGGVCQPLTFILSAVFWREPISVSVSNGIRDTVVEAGLWPSQTQSGSFFGPWARL